MDSMGSNAGDTALVLFVPEAERLVEHWRRLYDPAAAEGMPAHITVLYPFLPVGKISAEVRMSLVAFSRQQSPIPVTLDRIGRFPGVLWLGPGSAECTTFIRSVQALWPDLVPYGHPDLELVPHLTVVQGADEVTMRHIEAELRPTLPLEVLISKMTLVVFDGETWTGRDSFPFAQGNRAEGAFGD
jgi:2'-5' RNA ligase